MIVANRSRRLSIVRVAIIPGIAHAKLDINGKNAFPCKPTRDISLSIRNAARAM